MATAMIAALAFRGIYLRRLLQRHGFTRVVETWPMGVYRSLERANYSRATRTPANPSTRTLSIKGADEPRYVDPRTGCRLDYVQLMGAARSMQRRAHVADTKDIDTRPSIQIARFEA